MRNRILSKWLWVTVLPPTALAASFSVFYAASATRRLEQAVLTSPQGQSLRVIAEPKSGSPLTISSIVDTTTDPLLTHY